MTLPVFAYYYRRWDSYSLALAVPPIIYLGYFFVVSESPRWLISVGRVEDATKIVVKAAKMYVYPRQNHTYYLDTLRNFATLNLHSGT